MAAFSGFYESPGPPPSGNVRGITPFHRHDYPNGQQRRYIHLPSPPLLFEPEERAGWRMHAGFVGNADATASSAAAFCSAGAEVGTETTTALRFGWDA